MAFGSPHRDDCSTESRERFVGWLKSSLKTSSHPIEVRGYAGTPRPEATRTLYPICISYGDPSFSYAYSVPQDRDDNEPFDPKEHIPEQLGYIRDQLNKGNTRAELTGSGLETVLTVSKK